LRRLEFAMGIVDLVKHLSEPILRQFQTVIVQILSHQQWTFHRYILSST